MSFLWYLLASIGIALPNVLGFNLIFGKGKILHFGPIGVSLVTAYTLFLTLSITGSYFWAVGAGLIASVLISLLFAWLALRLDPDGLGILTIAMHLALLAVVLNWTTLTRGALGIPQIPRVLGIADPASFALLCVSCAALFTLFVWYVDRSALGRKLSALGENGWYGQAIGIDRRTLYVQVFLIGALGALITNVLYPQFIFLLHPNDYTYPFLVLFVMIVVAGKPGSVVGVIVSTILLIVLKESLRFLPLPADWVGPVRLLLFGIILLSATYFRRNELFPMQRTI